MTGQEQLATDLVPIAAELVGTVRDYGPDDIARVLERVPEGRHDALAVVLAAMVDPDRSPQELLAWTNGPVMSREFTPEFYGVKQVAAEAFGRNAERRAEILRLTREGLTRPQIAARLGVTVRCVERHRAALRQAMEDVA